ncbi:6-phosphofructo-2-kinase-domain-containing protein [Halteromyces radiatus]|uniref:6-phosphofructo-2-kinase-domain-containing protein n=1 Tax=Halteromyces radiatus TaxID=101107 RepID=UPI002220FACD|nr:6-phosphofructo-2-kinase-domain-containing protein [Halteromyces radiatus]KAI8086747.1 6-phosphofructo-2-kinase-domain-containing protein [Halteromyces radiatus]
MTSNIKLACVMVGLPARGKTFISYKVSRYLQWLGIKTKVFDVDDYQRKLKNILYHQDHCELSETTAEKQVLDDMLDWFQLDDNKTKATMSGTVAIYDGTNITKAKRKWIHDTLNNKNVQVLFVESQCDDDNLIRENIRNVKLSPTIMQQEKAIDDYLAYVNKHKDTYETMTEPDYTYIKLINAGQQYVINLVRGYLESRIVYYLINLNIKKKRIWLSRHGESQFNVQDRIGGDADLSPRGEEYARKLPSLISKHIGDELPLTVWTSTMKRTNQTARYIKYPKKQWKALDELDTGVCDGMTYDEIAKKYPEDFIQRDQDKFNFRYSGGESYRDLVLRLEPVIMELEQHERILIIAHQATIRCLYAYFMNLDHEQLPYARVPLHTLIELTPTAYNCEEKLYKADIESVDTYRPKFAGVENAKKSSNKTSGVSGEIIDSSEPILPLSPHP